MEHLLEKAERMALTDSPILISGESGTGKELIARYLHQKSFRSEDAFLAINCGSMPGELIESELFGHEAGAFTGAKVSKTGLFEEANNGTLFLDEIGTMPFSLQMKLLRTIQESEVRRVGSTKTRKINTRVISATNADLETEIQNGTFRADLFYRLGVLTLEVPTLRERIEDVELLAKHFLKKYSEQYNVPTAKITKEALQALETYSWPGNVRQLENVIERAAIFSEGEDLFLETLLDCNKDLAKEHHEAENELTLSQIANQAIKKAETEAIKEALLKSRGNKSQASRALSVSYKTLLTKIKDYKL